MEICYVPLRSTLAGPEQSSYLGRLGGTQVVSRACRSGCVRRAPFCSGGLAAWAPQWLAPHPPAKAPTLPPWVGAHNTASRAHERARGGPEAGGLNQYLTVLGGRPTRMSADEPEIPSKCPPRAGRSPLTLPPTQTRRLPGVGWPTPQRHYCHTPVKRLETPHGRWPLLMDDSLDVPSQNEPPKAGLGPPTQLRWQTRDQSR